MVIREGLKPSTFAFVARCSIQLSYLIVEGKTRLELAFVGFADPAVTNSGALPLILIDWLGIKDSNLGHPESESGVLPTELIPNGDFDGSRSRGLSRDRRVLSQLSYEAKNSVLVTAIQQSPFSRSRF